MISIKNTQEIEKMMEGGKILAKILKELSMAVRPGVSTSSLNKLAQELILFYGVGPSFLGQAGGFPAVLCTSVNDEIVHSVPSEKVILKEGDIIGLDFGVVHKSLHTDSAITVPVLGDQSLEAWKDKNKKTAKLLEVTQRALEIGIDSAWPGNHVGEIGNAIQDYVERNNFGVVRDLVGHGIGGKLHEEPHIPNFGNKKEGPILREGMTIAIEPMVTVGDWHIKSGSDGFTYKTIDGSLAAHFEHTIAITSKGPIVLTQA